MTAKTPPKDNLADVIDAADVRAAVDDFEAMDPAAQQAELDRLGFDADRMKSRLDAVLRAPEPSKVVSLAEQREKRSRRIGFLAVAAGVALALGGTGTWKASTYVPPRTVEYPTAVTGPRHEFARRFAHRARERCEQGYFGECQDDLDTALTLFPAIASEDDAIAARKALDDEARRDKTAEPTNLPNAKHGPAPGERPLIPLH